MATFTGKKWLTFQQVADMLPGSKGNARIHPKSVGRWARTGVRGVTLQATWIGGHRVTTEQWLEEFFSAIEIARSKPARVRKQTAARNGKSKRAARVADQARAKHNLKRK